MYITIVFALSFHFIRYMAAILRRILNYARRAPSPPIRFTNTNYEIVGASTKLEEETYSDYETGKYCPVRIGDVFTSKYQVVGKLGYGVSSTVWLARNLEYVYLAEPSELRCQQQSYL